MTVTYATGARAVQRGPVAGLVAAGALLSILDLSVGLGIRGWVVGGVWSLATAAALASGMRAGGLSSLGPANGVTLARAVLVAAVAALAADGSVPSVPLLVGISAVVLALDAIDGWVARRTGWVTRLGAQFDMEVDAFLILVLSVHVARSLGAWVLCIGAARYAFGAAGRLLPWLNRPVQPRPWRKVVAATQGVVLAVVSSGLVPDRLAAVLVAAALALLAESFGRDTRGLWRGRHSDGPRAAVGLGGPRPPDPRPGVRPGEVPDRA